MADKNLNILGLCGSLREASYNRGALRAAMEVAPADVTITAAEIGDLPLYNEDVREKGYPPPAERLRRQIAEADALLFVTPEYNYSIPGVLKNAIDWASRPPGPPISGKPAAIMGATPGNIGTARAQYHLRQCCVFLDVKVLNKPEVMIGQAANRFDAEGNLTDADTRKRIADLLAALADWTRLLAKA